MLYAFTVSVEIKINNNELNLIGISLNIIRLYYSKRNNILNATFTICVSKMN